MRNTILKATLAAIVLAAPLAATEASAKIKEVKFHFVNDAYADYPVYEMKYQNGKWVWANKGKAFKPRMKYRIKHNKGVFRATMYLPGFCLKMLRSVRCQNSKTSRKSLLS